MHEEEMSLGKTILACIVGVLMFVVAVLATADAFAEFYGAGNVDLDNRVVVENEDGSFSTELSITVTVDGYEVLLPTVVDGKIVSEDEAVDHFFKTGEHLGMFTSVEKAEEYAVWLHLRQEEHYGLSSR